MYKALIVDDLDINLAELEKLDVWGEKSGFIISKKARNGLEALEYLRKDRFDLVITDINMPRLDGFGLLKEIRKENLCRHVAFLSEHSEFEYARQSISLGAFDYLLKPAAKKEVLKLLSRAKSRLDESGESNFYYPQNEEDSIIAMIGTQNELIPEKFSEAAESVKRFVRGDDLLVADILGKFYRDIVSAIFLKYSWLPLYVRMRDFSREFPEPDAYRTSLSALIALIDRFVFPSVPAAIREICDYILENPESDISLQSISERFRVNNTYLSNLFRQKTNRRFNEYLTSVKIERAGFCLRNSDMKIFEISYALGYSDADYFNRLFKKYIGETPTAYRKHR